MEKESRGGSLTFRVGSGYPPGMNAKHGSFIFELANGDEILRIEGDGKIFVNKEQTTDNKELVDAFANWVSSSQIAHNGNSQVVGIPATKVPDPLEIEELRDSLEMCNTKDDVIELCESVINRLSQCKLNIHIK
jgi:hypothetical protein